MTDMNEPVEVAPGQTKPLGQCTREDLKAAAVLLGGPVPPSSTLDAVEAAARDAARYLRAGFVEVLTDLEDAWVRRQVSEAYVTRSLDELRRVDVARPALVTDVPDTTAYLWRETSEQEPPVEWVGTVGSFSANQLIAAAGYAAASAAILREDADVQLAEAVGLMWLARAQTNVESSPD